MENVKLSREALGSLVLETLRAVLAQANQAQQSATVNENTPLIGKGAALDSLGLLTLVVDVEQRLTDEYGLNVMLADDRAMSERNSPFRNVGTLAEFVVKLVAEQSNRG